MMWTLTLIGLGFTQGVLLPEIPGVSTEVQDPKEEVQLLRNRGYLVGGREQLQEPSTLDTPVQMVRHIYPDPEVAQAVITEMAEALDAHVETYDKDVWVWHRAKLMYSSFEKGKGAVSTDDSEHFRFVHRGLQNSIYREFGSGYFGPGIYSATNPEGAPGFGDYLLGIRIPKGAKVFDDYYRMVKTPEVGPCGSYTVESLFNAPAWTPGCSVLLRAALKAMGVVGLRFAYSMYNRPPGAHLPHSRSALIMFDTHTLTPKDVMGLVPGRTQVAPAHRPLLEGLSHYYNDLVQSYASGLKPGGPSQFATEKQRLLGFVGVSKAQVTPTISETPEDACRKVLPGAAGKPTLELYQDWRRIYSERP